MYNGILYKQYIIIEYSIISFLKVKKKFHFSPYDKVSKVKVQKQGIYGQVDISTCLCNLMEVKGYR